MSPSAPNGGSPENIVISGMMGTGKTTVGREVARTLGWEFVDLDDAVAAAAGKAVAEIFAEEGEHAFRAREREAVAGLAGRRRLVIATGGFTLGDPENAAALGRAGRVVLLAATPRTLAVRLAGETVRPPLQEAAIGALAAVMAARSDTYDRFSFRVATDERTAQEVAARVVELAGLRCDPLSIPVQTPSGAYRALIGEGTLEAAGPLIAALRNPTRAVVVTDGVVARHHLAPLMTSLANAGFTVTSTELPAGEAAKILAQVEGLYGAFLAAGLERGDLVIALGGGAVGDTAGFAAATYLRGVDLVHIPTTLLAMVDSSIGGKTGVNLAAGKNLVGAFHDPTVVLADPALLATLPDAQYREGLAEALKAALIDDPALFAAMEAGNLDHGAVLAPAVAVKARIVSRDPREGDLREHLNLGHTFAHAFEAASGYRLSHGRAVAIGLVAAGRLAERMGVAAPGFAVRIEAAVGAIGLPAGYPADAEAVLAAMAVDKKRRGGRLRFVVARDVGHVVVLDDVPEDAVRAVLATVALGETSASVPDRLPAHGIPSMER